MWAGDVKLHRLTARGRHNESQQLRTYFWHILVFVLRLPGRKTTNRQLIVDIQHLSSCHFAVTVNTLTSEHSIRILVLESFKGNFALFSSFQFVECKFSSQAFNEIAQPTNSNAKMDFASQKPGSVTTITIAGIPLMKWIAPMQSNYFLVVSFYLRYRFIFMQMHRQWVRMSRWQLYRD